ncbi:DUF2442 domain-containing protein [Bacteroidales bacterium OttesenSCG-928-E04]|nr:DUF2442 domain-containing protein [Bacteroidales bacterium OttesenSCG-928-E04]
MKNNFRGESWVKPYLNIDSFKKLKNKLVFNSVHVSFDTVEWQDEIDIDPEILYMDSVEIAK